MLIMNCNSNKKYRSKAQSPPAERRLRRLHFIGDFAENGNSEQKVENIFLARHIAKPPVSGSFSLSLNYF